MPRSSCRPWSALIAGNFEGASRKVAYAVIGGVAGAGIAVGPILGGWATTELSWRIVFAGEVLLVAADPGDDPEGGRRAVRTGPAPKPRRRRLGAVRARPGPGRPRRAAVEHLGLGQAQGGLADRAVRLLADALRDRLRRLSCSWAFAPWQASPREHADSDPLVHLGAAEDRPAALRPDRTVQPEPDPDGRLLHDPAVPAAGDRARRPGDRHQDAARVHRHVPRLRGRAHGCRAASRPVDRAGRPVRPRSSRP